jgi:hypothetical protein
MKLFLIFSFHTLEQMGTRAAYDHSIRAIIVLDPRCLENENSRNALIELSRKKFRAGCLIPAETADQNAVRLIEQYRTMLQPPEDAPDWVVRISVGNMAQFRTAVSSVADDILARIVKSDRVRQSPPDNAGPTTLRRIANRLDTEPVV